MVTLLELHSFIRSLNKAEKRFFKLLTATESDCIQRTILLFDCLDSIKSGDDVESRIKKRHRTILNHDNVNHLYRLILASQRNFYSVSIPGFSLIDEINNLKILFEKAQYKQCHKMLRTTKETALELEKFGAAMQLVEIEKHLLGREMLDNSYSDVYNNLVEEHKKYRDLEKNTGCFFRLYSRVRDNITRGSDANETCLRQILSHSLLSNPEAALSKKSRFLYFLCRATAHLALWNTPAAAADFKNAKELMESEKLFFVEMPRQYLDVLFYSSRLELAKNPHSAPPALLLLENLLNSGKVTAVDLNLKLRACILLTRMQLNYNLRRISETDALALEIGQFINENADTINREDALQLLSALGSYYIYTLSFDKAAEAHSLLNKYSNNRHGAEAGNYSVLQGYIIAFETGNTGQARALKNLLLKKTKEGVFGTEETKVINTLLNPPQSTEKDPFTAIIENYHDALSSDSFRNNLDLSYMNCMNYLISKAGENFQVQKIFNNNHTLSETNI